VNSFRKNWIFLLIATLPFERIPSFDVNFAGHAVTLKLSYLIAVGAIGLFGWDYLKRFRWDFKRPETWMAVYLFVIILSSFGAVSRTRSLVVILATALVMATAMLVADRLKASDTRIVYVVLAGVTAAVCVFGLYQFIGDSLGLGTAWTGLRSNYTRDVFGFPRIQSTALEPLFLGSFLLIPLILTLGAGVTGRLKKPWLLPLLGVITCILTLTLSRGAFAGAIVATLAIGILLARHMRLRFTLLSVGVAALGIGIAFGLIALTTSLNKKAVQHGSAAVTRFARQSTTVSSGPSAADADRGVNRQLALDAFGSRPILGYGIGNFGTYAESAFPAMYRGSGGHITVNNEYLEVLAETGIAGALALAGIVISLAIMVLHALRNTGTDPKLRFWITCLSAICVGFAVQYYAFSTLYVMHIWVVVGLLIALCRASGTARVKAR
jgi:O-antigen ligase